MNPPLAALLCAALSLPACAHADPPAGQLADLINAYRAAPHDCGGAVAPLPPLASVPALAALQVGPGTFLESALKRLGFAAERAEALSVSGPLDAGAAFDVLRQKYCRRLLSEDFDAIGSARSGNAWQVVLAHALVIPQLPGWENAGREVLALSNRSRATARRCGEQALAAAPPLAWNERLGRAALGHSANLAQGRYFSHQEKDGSLPADRVARSGYAWRLVGENIASGNRTPQDAVAAWLASPGHCANLMNPRFTEMGAAYAIDPLNENRTPYWTQVFAEPR